MDDPGRDALRDRCMMDLELLAGAVTAAIAAGAAVGSRVSPARRSVHPPPPGVCAPGVADKIDELHGLLGKRTDTGASVVLEHLSELPRIRELLEHMARR